MNRIYNLVFNRARSQVQVASEFARGRRRGARRHPAPRALPALGGLCLAMALAAAPAAAQVAPEQLPANGQMVGGISDIQTVDHTMTITQTQARGVIRWDTFDIGEDARVVFAQALGDVVLNQILDSDPSQIFGRIDAVGTVFLINPRGIVFGETAQINVGGLLASTLDIDADDFLAQEDGAYLWDSFAMTPEAPGRIENLGQITAGAGGVTMVGASIDNSGLVQAQLGSINLYGTETATLSLGSSGLVAVSLGTPLASLAPEVPAAIENTGTLEAGATVLLHANTAAGFAGAAVNSSGIIRATSIGGDAGRVELRGAGAGSVATTGTVTADGELVTGGETVRLGGTLATGGDQVHEAPTELSAATTLASATGDILFGGTVDGGFGLDVSAAQGTVTFAGAIGGTDPLAALDVDARAFTAQSTLAVQGPLAVTVAQGGIGQSDAWTVGGTAELDAGAGGITLAHAGNDFGDTVSLAGGVVEIVDSGALSLGDVAVGSLDVSSAGALDLGRGSIAGTLVARSGVHIGQSGALLVGGTALLDAGSGSIELSNADNDFDGPVTASGASIVMFDRDDLSIASLDILGGLVRLDAGGTLTLPAAAIDTGGYDLELFSRGGALQTGGALTGADVRLWGGDGITLGHDVTATGTLRLDSGAGIAQSAGTLAAGVLQVDAAGPVALGSWNAVQALGAIDVEGNLLLRNTPAITQTALGSITVEGAATFASGGAITLANAGNRFDGVVNLAGGAARIQTSGALRLGDLDVASLEAESHDDLDLGQGSIGGALVADSNGGDIGQSGALTVAGTSTLDAGGGAITLEDIDNDFVGSVRLTGGAVSIIDRNTLTLGELSVDGLEVISLGDLDLGLGQVRGHLEADSGGGGIRQSGALSVHGVALLDAGAGGITLAHAGNDFGDTVSLAGGVVEIVDSGELSLGDVAVGSLDVSSADALDLGRGSIAGPLVARSGVHIGQSGSLEVGGTALLDAGSGSITLMNAGNRFDGVVNLAGGAVRIQASGALRLGDLDVASLEAESHDDLDLGQGSIAGALVADSNGGDIGQSGALTVAGTSTLDAGGGAITLEDSDNDFVGSVRLTGGAVSIADRNMLTLGPVDASSLEADAAVIAMTGDVTTSGDQAYHGAIWLAGNLLLQSASGDITFNSTVDGAFALDASAAGGAVTFMDAVGGVQALAGLGVVASEFAAWSGLRVGGDLALTVAQGGIGQSGPLGVGGTATLDAGDGDITLAHAGNDFAGTVHLAGGSVSIRDMNDLTLGDLAVDSLVAESHGVLDLGAGNIAGDLVATSDGGDIVQSGALTVGGTSTLDAGIGAIALGDADNDFGGAVDATGTGITIVDLDDLTIAALNAGANGTVHLEAGGTLALPAMSIDTGAADLVLVARGGPLATSGVLRGANVALTGGGGLTLGHDVTATDALSLESGAGIAQTVGVLTAGLLEVDAAGAVALGADNVVATLGDVDVGGSFLLRNTPAIVQSLSGSIVIGGEATFQSGGAITLANAGNSFGDVVNLAGGAARIETAGALRLGGLGVASLEAESQGDLDLGQGSIAGDLVAISNGGDIGQSGALAVGGTSTLDADGGNITLADAGNDFAGPVHMAGGAAVIADVDTLALGSVDVSSLDATATTIRLGTDIATTGDQAYRGAVELMDDRVLASTGGDITFGSTVGGAHALDVAARAGAVTFTGAVGGSGPLTGLAVDAERFSALSTLDTSGDLALTAAQGGIGQSGAWTAGGTTTLDAGNAAITLGDAGNAFAGVVHLTGGAATIVNSAALTLGAVDVASLDATSDGDLDLGSGDIDDNLVVRSNGGAIGQSGALAVGGTSTIDAGGGDITLAGTGNDFVGVMHLAGGAATIVDANALSLGTLDLASLEVASHGDLGLGSGSVAGGLLARSNGGAIGQSGALRVGGTSDLDAGAGALVLEHAGNDFIGAVAAAGAGVSLFDANDLLLASIDGRGGAVSLVAGGNLTLPAQAIDAGGADLRLAALGGTLSTRGPLSGGDISLQGRDGINLGDDVTAIGTLALESGGAVNRTGGVLTAQTLTGRVGGAATLGNGNAISELGAFSAGELQFGSAGALAVTGPVEAGSRLALRAGGDLDVHELLSANEVRLDADGAITLDGAGRIVAGTLSGSAGGPTWLGGRDSFVDNQVDVLGGFTSHAGFSMTNAGTLTLASVGGSAYSVDAGSAATYLSVVDGHLLQQGTTPIRNGVGFYASTGHIGLADSPIHVIGEGEQTVELIGLPPAYFFALRADGSLLPVVGANAVNVPVSVISSRVQRSAQGEVEYVDLGADASGYRAYGIVQPGIRLPDDQRPECDPDFPGPECIDA